MGEKLQKFFVLSQRQMDEMLRGQRGGAIDIDAQMRQRELARVQAKINRVLRAKPKKREDAGPSGYSLGDVEQYQNYKALEDRLTELLDWFRARDAAEKKPPEPAQPERREKSRRPRRMRRRLRAPAPGRFVRAPLEREVGEQGAVELPLEQEPPVAAGSELVKREASPKTPRKSLIPRLSVSADLNTRAPGRSAKQSAELADKSRTLRHQVKGLLPRWWQHGDTPIAKGRAKPIAPRQANKVQKQLNKRINQA